MCLRNLYSALYCYQLLFHRIQFVHLAVTGWLNFLDYKTGAAVTGNIVATKTNAPIVGINVLYVKGKPVVNIVTADNPTPQFPAVQPQVYWGELLLDLQITE